MTIRTHTSRAVVLGAAILVSSLVSTSSARAEEKSELDRYTWELSSIYPSEETWEAERLRILSGIESAGALRATIASDPRSLADGLDAVSDLRTRATKMEIYGELAYNLDRNSAEARRKFEVGTELVSEVESGVAFLPESVGRIGPERLEQWFVEEPRLERHRIRITRTLREAPHTLPTGEQALIASMARWPQLCSDVFDAAQGADLGWPTMPDSAGKRIPVTFYSYRYDFPREKREESLEALLTRLAHYQDLFGLLYTRRIEADLTIARHRKFDDGIEAIWFLRDGMPREAAPLIVSEARRHLPVFQRYLALRARALGLGAASYGGLFIPPPDAGQTFRVAEALGLAVEAAAPLGPAYQERMRRGIEAHWLHLPPWPQKRGVFEVFPGIGMAHPYMLTSFRPTYRGARQLTGALFDMMKDADIPADRQPDSRDDPPVYGNGIIYVGDMLFDDLVRSRAKDRQTRIVDTVQALDLIWSNFFQTAVFTELDTRVQQLVRDGKAPSGTEISKMYLALLHEYAGAARVDDVLGGEWMIYDVSFFSFEHQFWAAAVAAGANIVGKIRAGDPNGVKAADEVYGRGDSDRSYWLLRQAGIDMTTPEAYGPLFRRMTMLCDELETLLGN